MLTDVRRIDWELRARDGATPVFNSLHNTMGRLQAGYMMLTRFIGGAAISVAVQQIASATLQAERASNRLDSTLRATAGAAGIARTELAGIAQEISAKTGFDDDQVTRGLTALLRYRDVQRDVFRDAAQLGPDLAVALETDLVGVYEKLGRAVNDPANGMKGLREAGLKLSEQQVQMVRWLQMTGNMAGAQRIMMEELTKSIGGGAAAENKGASGAISRFTHEWNAMLKALGQPTSPEAILFFNALAGSLERMRGIAESGSLKDMMRFMAITPFGFGAMGFPFFFNAPKPRKPAGPTAADIEDAEFGAFRRDAERNQELQKERADAATRTLGPARAKIELETERSLIEQRQQVFDDYYKENLLSAEHYFTQRRELIARGLSAELTEIEAQLRVQRYVLGKADTVEEQAKTQAEIEALISRRSAAQRKASQEFIMLAGQERRAAQAFEDQLNQVAISIAELQGRTDWAANARFNFQNKDLMLKIRATYGEESPQMGELKRLRNLTVDAEKMKRMQEEADRVQQALANRETEIESGRRTGAITDLAAMQQISTARQRSLEQLRQIAEAMTELARVSGDEKMVLAAETFNARLLELGASADLVGERIRTSLVDPITDFLDALALRTKSLKDALLDLGRNLATQTLHLANQQIAQQIVGGGVGDFATGLLRGVLGGTRDSGGMVSAGVTYEIGRREYFTPSTSGRISTPEQMRVGRQQPVVNITVQTPDANSFMASRRQIARAYANALSSGVR